eukprot:1709536-Alexandrium_andersonii.AAC.1
MASSTILAWRAVATSPPAAPCSDPCQITTTERLPNVGARGHNGKAGAEPSALEERGPSGGALEADARVERLER